jgi:hypothetical protein
MSMDARVAAADAATRDAAGAGLDAAVSEAGASDARVDDAGATDASMPVLPMTLAETGLYVEGSTSELAPGVQAFAPRYPLWSDAADKQRWLLLPAGAQIDTSDMDDWQFPVGTKVWKEFARDGMRLETRLLWKTETGWFRMAFVWNDDETEAIAAPRGATDVRGTMHNVPTRSECRECHDGRSDTLLGVSAIQLAHDGPGVTLQGLQQAGLLSDPPAAEPRLPDGEQWNALGYLHANCGSCHNPISITWDKLDLELWLPVAEIADATTTRSYLSTIGVALTDTASANSYRIAAGDPGASGLVERMQLRGDNLAMPPLASELVDEQGVALISSWIEGL